MNIKLSWQDADMGFRQGEMWRNRVQEFLKDNDGNILGEAMAISGDGKTICEISNYTGLGYIWNQTEGTTYVTSDIHIISPK